MANDTQVETRPTISVEMTLEDWQSVQLWLKHGADVNSTSMVWWRDCCADKRYGAETAAKYAQAAENAERLHAIIEAALYPDAQPTETE